MGEAASEAALLGAQAKERRKRLIAKLSFEIGLIRREFEKPRVASNVPGFLYDFEKQAFFYHREVRSSRIPRRKESALPMGEAEKAKMVVEYGAEARVLMVIDVLRHSRKVVFGEDWDIGYRENNVINVLRKIDRRRRRKGLLQGSGEHSGMDGVAVRRIEMGMTAMEEERKRVLSLVGRELMYSARRKGCSISSAWGGRFSGGDRDVCGSTAGNEGVFDGVEYGGLRAGRIPSCSGVKCESVIFPRMRDDCPQPVFKPREYFSLGQAGNKDLRPRAAELFKRHLKIFSKLSARRSSRYSFELPQVSATAHPTNQHIFKKIPMEYLRCKSARDIVGYKYRNTTVDETLKMAKEAESKRTVRHFEDDSFGDFHSSVSDEAGVEYSLLIETALGKTCAPNTRGRGSEEANDEQVGSKWKGEGKVGGFWTQSSMLSDTEARGEVDGHREAREMMADGRGPQGSSGSSGEGARRMYPNRFQEDFRQRRNR